MHPAATRPHAQPTLHLAFELGNREWMLAMTPRIDQAPLRRSMSARALKTLEVELARARAHFGRARATRVCSAFEAGRAGIGLQRSPTRAGGIMLALSHSS